MAMAKNKLGIWLQKKREEEVLTQIEFADKIGISQVTLSNIEHGGKVGFKTIRKIADYAKIPPNIIHEMMLTLEERE